MAKKQRPDALSRLIRIFLILLIIFAVLAVGFFLVNRLASAQLGAKMQQVAEENQRLVEEREEFERAQNQQSSAGESAQWPTAAVRGWDVLDLTGFALENTRTETVARAELLTSGLMLINRWHALPADVSEETLASVGATTSYRVPVSGSSVMLYPNAISALDQMLADAGEAGLKYYIVRQGYRTMAEQQTMFDEAAARLSSKWSGDVLIEETRKEISYPGTGEYQTGFSFQLDLYSREDTSVNSIKFQESDQAAFVNENGWQYGIIFRFPTQGYPSATTTDKTYKTGESRKMDIYRYVGVEHATVMHILDMCLEEYVEYLIAHPHIAVYEDGKLRYEIYRQEGGDDDATQVEIPVSAASFTASIDNMGGVVVACTFK